MLGINPYTSAHKDAQKFLTRAKNRFEDFRKTFTTAALLWTLGGTGVAVATAALNFPMFAYVAVAVVFLALSLHAIYMTKIVKAQDRDARWTYVPGKRVQQRELDAKIAMDTVTLALMGENHAPSAMRSASPELRSALAYHQHRLRLAEQRADAAEAVKEGTATSEQRRTLVRLQRDRQPAPPKGPAVEPIKARRAALVAERAELEAEIQSLATADSIEKATETEEVQGTRRTKRERQDAARKADQAARERVRAGKSPTAPEQDRLINLSLSPNGARDVSSGRGPLTPEQIAAGEDEDAA